MTTLMIYRPKTDKVPLGGSKVSNTTKYEARNINLIRNERYSKSFQSAPGWFKAQPYH